MSKGCFRNFCSSRREVEPRDENGAIDAQLVHLMKIVRGREEGREGRKGEYLLKNTIKMHHENMNK